MHHQILHRYITFNSYTTNYRYRSSDKVITSTSNLGLIDQVEGDYVQTSPPASNEWHYVRISKKKENVFTWKNKAGVEWDLILTGKEKNGFKVGENCNRYTEALLSAEGDTVEIRGPHGIYTKQ